MDFSSSLTALDYSLSLSLPLHSKSFNAHYLFVARKFFFGMIALRIAFESKGVRRRKQLKVAKDVMNEMEQWAKQGGLNCLHKLLILQAEYNAFRFICKPPRGCLQRGPPLDFTSVQRDYDRAISTSTRSGFRNDAAVAAERAYIFCDKCNQKFLARSYRSQAIGFYNEWGATSKVQQMATEGRKNESESLELPISTEFFGTQSMQTQPRTVDHSRLGLSHLEQPTSKPPQLYFAESLSSHTHQSATVNRVSTVSSTALDSLGRRSTATASGIRTSSHTNASTESK